MWEINALGDLDVPGFQYREARFADLAESNSTNPVRFLGRIIAADHRTTLDEDYPHALLALENAIPTWLRPDELNENFLTRVKDDPSEWTSAVAVQVPGSEEAPGWVWLDQSFVLIRKPVGVSTLEVVYTVPDEDHARSLRLESQFGGPSIATLEWYGTVGTNTTITSGESTLQGHGRVKRALLYLSEKSGYLLGRVVRNRITAQSRRTTDPLWENRRRELEARKMDLANSVPDIRDIKEAGDSASDLVVLVHGTFSSGMRMLAALQESGLHPSPSSRWVRYEHDTFLPVSDNANELAELIESLRRHHERILLVCHSRGGLVGVTAASQLVGPPWESVGRWRFRFRRQDLKIEVFTFGTPHLGTPLSTGAESIGATLRAIMKSSSRMAFNSLGLDPVGWAFGWAIGRVAFPRGVAAMSPDSDFIALYRRQERSFPIAVAGGYFDDDCEADGYFAVAKQKALSEVMDHELHDGVVPLESSLGIGDLLCAPARQCGHSDYFSRDDTLELLRKRLQNGSWD